MNNHWIKKSIGVLFAIIVLQIKVLAISVVISGMSNICPSGSEYDYTYSYTYEVFDAGCRQVEKVQWFITGGDIISGANADTVTVRWHASTTNKFIVIDVDLDDCGGTGGASVSDMLNVDYKSQLDQDSIKLIVKEGLITGPTYISNCDTITLKTNPEVYENLAGTIKYYWFYSTDSSDFKQFNYTTGSTNNNTTFYASEQDDLSSSDKIYFKVDAYSSCKTIHVDRTSGSLGLKYCFENLETEVTDPTCYDSTNATIQISGLPIPDTCATYDPSEPLHNKFILTLERYTEAPSVGGVIKCSSNGANGSDIPFTFDGIDGEFCLSGYVANYSFDYTNDTILLTQEEIVLRSEDDPNDTMPGVYPGLYEMYIENVLFDSYTFFSQFIDSTDQLMLDSAGPLNEYKYIEDSNNDKEIFNIKNVNGTDAMYVSISGGTRDYTYNLYRNDNSSVKSGTLTSSDSVNIDGNPAYIIDNIDEDTFYIKISDLYGCPSNVESYDFSLNAPEEIDTSGFIIQDVSCNSGNTFPVGKDEDGAFQTNVTGGIGPYTLYIDGASKDTTSGDYELTSIDLGIGEHAIRIEDKYGNFNTFTKSISEPDPVQIHFIDTIDPVCSPIADGKLVVLATGGSNSYQDFELLDPSLVDAAPDTLSHIDANTTYTVSVSDSSECTQTEEFISGEYSNPLTYNLLDTFPAKCIGGNTGKIILKASGGHDSLYTETNIDEYFGSKHFESSDSTIEISDLKSLQDYEIKISDSEGCEFINTININENPVPVQIQFLDSAEITCENYNDGWVELTGVNGDPESGNYTYYLDSVEQGSSSQIKLENLTPGVHTLAIEDTNKCMHPDTISDKGFYQKTILVDEPAEITRSTEIQNVKIKGTNTGYFKCTLAGGNNRYIYRFTNETDVVLQTDTVDQEVFVDDLYAGDYRLQVKDTCGCTNGQGEWLTFADITLTEPAEFLDLQVLNIGSVQCYGGTDGTVILNGTGGTAVNGYKYGKTKNNVIYESGEFGGLASGNQMFYVKDDNDIIDSLEVYIPQPEPIVAGISAINNVSCFNGDNGQATLHVIGGTGDYSCSVDNWATTITDTIIGGLSAGNYEVLVSDSHSCYDTVELVITQPEKLLVTSVSTVGTLCGESNGSSQAFIAGGTEPYYYEWYNSLNELISNESEAFDLYSGDYNFYVTDANGCDTNAYVVISNTDGPEIDLTGTKQVTCSGYTDGKAFYTIGNSKGVAPFNMDVFYNNSDIPLLTRNDLLAGEDSIADLEAGEYKIKLSDQNNCIAVIDFVITTPNPMSIVLEEIQNPVCFGYSNGKIEVSASGGNGNYSFNWDNSVNNALNENLKSGSYSVTVSDENNCTVSSVYELTDPEKLEVNIGEDQTICEGQNIELFAGDFESYTWKYNDDIVGTGSGITINSEGEYTVHVEDENACFAEDTMILNISRDLLEAEFLMASESYVNDTIVIIDISWPLPDYSEWKYDQGIVSVSSETFIEEITFTEPGIYNVQLTSHMAMCVDSITKQINILDINDEEESQVKLGSDETIIQEFKIYPNPSFGQFYIDIELSQPENIELRIFSLMQNNYVLIDKLYQAEKYKLDYSLMDFKSGIYLVSIIAGDQQKTKRLLITK